MKCSEAGTQKHVRYKANGLTRADVVTGLVVLGILLVSLCIFLAPYRTMHTKDMYARCGRNLATIGKAISTYANDYDGVLPVAGGEGTVWGPGLNDWKGESRDVAFGLDPNDAGGQASISSSLYLLVKHAGISPELFVCPKDKGTTVFRPETYGIGTENLKGVWDFGPDPTKHCSYAYHMPYGSYRLTTSGEPGMPVAADPNPWIDGPRQKAGDFSSFKPDLTGYNGTSEEAFHGNSQVHRIKRSRYGGQNVLFLDGHVEFAMRAFCGIEEDNIYTSWDGKDKARGIPPKPYESKPAHEFDSLLVNDPPLGR